MLLSDWLQAQHPENERLSVAESTCDTVHNAQATGMLRGELGPERLDLSSDGVCEILPPSPAPPALVYRAPEARSGSAPGPTSSVYSAGVILYEILAGRQPREGEGGSPVPLRNLRRDLPAELADAVMACLEKDPDWRPKDVSYVLQMIRRLRGGAPPQPVGRSTVRPPAAGRSTARPPAAGRSTLSPLSIADQPLGSYTAVRRRGGRSGPPLWLLVSVAVVVVGAGAFFWLKSTGSLEGLIPAGTPAPTSAGTQPEGTPQPTPAPVADAAAAIATPTPRVASTATPVPMATPTPEPIATPTPMAMVTPVPTPTPLRTTPTPAPTPTPTPIPRATATPTPRPTPPPPPASLSNMAPRGMARGTNLYDLHGTNLRDGLRVVVLKGADLVAPGVTVVRQKIADPSRMQIVVRVDADAEPGSDYAVVLVDEVGKTTNRVKFQIAK